MNPKIWMIATIILAVALVVVLFMSYGGLSGTFLVGGTSTINTANDPGTQYKNLDETLKGVQTDGLAKAVLMIIYYEDHVEYMKLAPGSDSEKITQMRAILEKVTLEIKDGPIKITIIYDDGTHKSKYFTK